MKQYHVGIAAEAFAAGAFAHAGCDVSVQYGANQPGYDLMVARSGRHALVSVKGSKDGGWGLIQNHKNKSVTYHQAIDYWLLKHDQPMLVFCLVQFRGVSFGELPRLYLATPLELANYLKASRGGHGYTSARERYVWSGGIASGAIDSMPSSWRFSLERLALFLPLHTT
jgi:hypothetical protein